MTDTNPHELIQRLTDALDATLDYTVSGDTRSYLKDLVAEASAYLVQSAPEAPTDEEILALSQEHGVSYTMLNGDVIYPGQEGSYMRDDVLSFARAVLARWGK